jgi:hypothetical protein
MTAPVLALAPVPMMRGTGTGAGTGPIREQGHRYHPVGETRMEKQEGPEGGRLTAPPGRRRPLSPSCPATVSRHARGGGW